MRQSYFITNNILKAILTGFALLFLATSCTQVYLPNALFTPMFEEKGDIRVQASVGIPELSLQSGYAFGNNIAITAGGLYFPFNDNGSRAYLLESGLAYFNNPGGNYSYDLMAGAGYGETRHINHFTTIFSGSQRESHRNADFTRVYLQYGIHFPAKPLTFSLVSRMSNLYFFKYEDYLLPEGASLNDKFEKNIYGLFMEPNLHISLDVGKVSLFTQTGFVLPIAGPGTDIDHNLMMFNFGVRLNFNAFKR